MQVSKGWGLKHTGHIRGTSIVWGSPWELEPLRDM